MIPRYTRPEMAAIWDPQTRYRIWFEIEAHAADAMAELGVIPKAAAKAIWEKGKHAKFDVARIDAIEREVRHDVIAFLTHLAEIVGPQARFVHQGMTSSDVLDTCLNVQLVRAADLLIADVDALMAALRRRAFEHKLTPTIGRSHGIHAEPTTFGLKLASAYAEFFRAKERLICARTEVATCAISGAVGTFAQVDPRVEEHIAEAMGLGVEPISTQVIPRHRHPGFRAGPTHLDRRQARGLSRQHAKKPGATRRAHPFAARPDRADPEGRPSRGRLSASAAQRHAGLAGRRRFPDLPQG